MLFLAIVFFSRKFSHYFPKCLSAVSVIRSSFNSPTGIHLVCPPMRELFFTLIVASNWKRSH